VPRYHLHQKSRETTIADDEGAEFATLEDAREEALAAAREAMSETMLQGFIDLFRQIEIRSATGEVLLKVSYAEAVDLRY
jgi:hypothetical protein